MGKLIRELLHISILASLHVNFRVLPFHQAVKFPILIARHVKIDGKLSKDAIKLNGRIRPGQILLGFGGSVNSLYTRTRRSYLSISGTGQIVFEGTARFSPQFTLIAKDATLKIGTDFSCNNGSMIICNCAITLGDNCMLGRDIEIRDSDGHYIIEKYENQEIIKPNERSITIGNHVWICSHVTILKGVEIGNDCVIAHSSVCTKPIHGSGLLIGGYPAKVIRKNISWKK